MDKVESKQEMTSEEAKQIISNIDHAWRNFSKEEYAALEWLLKKADMPDYEAVFSKLDRSMECLLESDHRSFTNRETENGWIFDHIIEWRKMIHPYIKD